MKQFVIVSFVLAFLVSCSNTRMNSFKEPDFSISNYKSFDFYSLDMVGVNKELENEKMTVEEFNTRVEWIKESIGKQLEKYGLQQDRSNPDLRVNIGIFIQEVINTRETTFPQDAPLYIGQRNYSWESETIETSRYDEGTITIDLVQTSNNDLVWMGYITGPTEKDPVKAKEKLDENLGKLFSFP